MDVLSHGSTLATWCLPPKNVMITSHLQFLNVAFGSLGFFLTSTFPPLKHIETPPALHSVAICFAASTQHWCVQKLLVCVLESRLISIDGATQIPILAFEVIDGTTQEFVSGTFRVCKFQNCLLAKYLISVNSGSCSHINFVQTAVEEKLILCCVLVSPIEHLPKRQ